VAILDELKGKKFPVLDDGFVALTDVMGDDSDIVQAARTSYQKGTKKLSDDRGLIRYLMSHRHSSPFEFAELKFLVRVPIDAWRQWSRHRTASISEYSTRYSEAIDSKQKTHPREWRTQSTTNKQGSGGTLEDDVGVLLSRRESFLHEIADSVYQERLLLGVAREQARKDLPLSTFTEAFWKIDLHNLLHFLGLRMDSHAQQEIRAYATIIGEQIVKPLFPLTWEAFVDFRMEAMSLSRLEIEAIRKFMDSPLGTPIQFSTDVSDRERSTAFAKFERLGIKAP
jgi:thymidylate synthase (FAD)